MRLHPLPLAALLAVVLLALPSQAVSCRQWVRMDPYQKSATVDRMIDNAARGSGGRQYGVSRTAVVRCLERYAVDIEYAFDDACADSRTAGMSALNGIFKRYIWTCID